MKISNNGRKHELNERLQFETLLTEIASSFVNLPIEQIDATIHDAQRRICEHLNLDRSAFWIFSKGDPGKTQILSVYQPPGAKVPGSPFDANDHFPWSLHQVLNGKIIVLSSLLDLPPEAGADRATFIRYGTKSTVLIPFWIDGAVSGALTFACMKKEKIWQESIIKRFELIAQIFANVLARKIRKAEQDKDQAHLDMATSAAGVGLWSMYPDTGKVWASAKTRELFHFSEGETLSRKSFYKVIHPEDLTPVDRAIQASIETDVQLSLIYRIVLPDGAVRWIYTSGKRFVGSSGKPPYLMGVCIDISERKRMEENLRMRIEEIEILKQKLELENYYLREEIDLQNVHEEIVGRSQAIRRILLQVEQVAMTDSTVLIQGETGTGKELLARAVHRLSARKDRPMVTVNCASLPPTLIESELFGREKGAYTGAMTKMIGRFEVADGSTLFLDEIGELPMDLQSKLLRVLEEGKFERLGSTRTLHVDVRVIAATNRDIRQEIKKGGFRQDLFYRLNVFPILIPPLRERTEDIPLLVWAFVKEFEKKMGKKIENLPKKAMHNLKSYPWPGNVRELRNMIEHAMILNKTATLHLDIPHRGEADPVADSSLENLERSHIAAVLEKTGWRVSGRGGAAEILGLKRTTLEARMKKLGIQRSAQPVPK